MSEPSRTDDKTVSSQIQHSGIGEILGFGISIGAVYLTDLAFPRQRNAFVRKLAEHMGEWRGTSLYVQRALAQQITDVAIMNLGGISNMAAQFAMRRHASKPEDRQPLGYELGRVISGRIAGTVTAIGALAIAQTAAPDFIKTGQQQIAGLIGRKRAGQRFGELVMSNLVQSAGGVAGNIPAQLLYDKIVCPQKSIER